VRERSVTLAARPSICIFSSPPVRNLADSSLAALVARADLDTALG
jgi:hypothetical protein